MRASLLILLAVLSGAAVQHSQAQTRRPAPGEKVSVVTPVYEGWFKNQDGNVVLTFGYISRHAESIEIPVGENNSFAPAPQNRRQPTTFLPGRQKDVVQIVLPADFRGNMAWTLAYGGSRETTTPSGGLNPLYIITEPPPRADAA